MNNRLIIIAVIAVLVAAGAWFLLQEPEETQFTPPVANVIAPPLTPPTPVVVNPTPSPANTDVLALSEEEIDRIKAEQKELASRASDLESQVKDGQELIALKEKQIKDIEEQLKALNTPNKVATPEPKATK